jgi:2-dehydropantoate 2-reductase
VAGPPTESDYILGDLVTRAHAHNIEAPLLGMAAIQLRIHDIRANAAPVSRQLR